MLRGPPRVYAAAVGPVPHGVRMWDTEYATHERKRPWTRPTRLTRSSTAPTG